MRRIERLDAAIKRYGVDDVCGASYAGTSSVQIDDPLPIIEGLLKAVEMPPSLIKLVMYGPTDLMADCEFSPGRSGLVTWHGPWAINWAERIGRRWAFGEKRIEIGMKYPRFDVDKFMHQFKARLVGPVENREITYWLYKDVSGNVYTFAPDAIGKGGYAGAVMADLNQARRFLRFLLGNRKHYIKDINVGFNSLGGLGITEVDDFLKAV